MNEITKLMENISYVVWLSISDGFWMILISKLCILYVFQKLMFYITNPFSLKKI